MIVLAPATDHPEEYLGDTLGELVEPTAAALEPDGTYVVEWNDAYFFGSQAFGLVNELRRAGYDVGAGEFWTVPITSSADDPDRHGRRGTRVRHRRLRRGVAGR